MTLIGADGAVVDCGFTPVTPDEDVAKPQALLCDRIPVPGHSPATQTAEIRRPFFVHVEVWDADGPGYPPSPVPALELDTNPGSHRFGELGPFNFPFPSRQQLMVRGPEAAALVTVTTRPKTPRFTNVCRAALPNGFSDTNRRKPSPYTTSVSIWAV